MCRRMSTLSVVALLVLPVAGVLAAPPNQVPSGLLNAQAKIQTAINRQIANENARYDKLSAKLNGLLAPLQDLQDQASALETEIADLGVQLENPLLTQGDSDALNAQLQADETQLAGLQDQIAAMQDDLANVQAHLDRLEQQHAAKLLKLQTRYQTKTDQFDAKIAAWQAKYSEEEPPQ
jgi:chromosome segregation ATPase